MINDYNKLSEQERTKAIKLYQQSIKNKMIASFLTPLQNELTDFCKENDLMIDGTSAIILDVFQQDHKNYSIAFCAYPDSETKSKVDSFESAKELLNWKFFDLTKKGIDSMLNVHQQLIHSITFFTDFNIEKMYNLAEELENFDESKVSGQFGSL